MEIGLRARIFFKATNWFSKNFISIIGVKMKLRMINMQLTQRNSFPQNWFYSHWSSYRPSANAEVKLQLSNIIKKGEIFHKNESVEKAEYQFSLKNFIIFLRLWKIASSQDKFHSLAWLQKIKIWKSLTGVAQGFSSLLLLRLTLSCNCTYNLLSIKTLFLRICHIFSRKRNLFPDP